MALSLGLAQQFQEFVEKWDVFSKITAEMAKNGLGDAKLGKEAVLLPVLMDLTGRVAEVIPEESRVDLPVPHAQAGDKLTEDLVAQMADFVMKAVPMVGEEQMTTLINASVGEICIELANNYKNKQ